MESSQLHMAASFNDLSALHRVRETSGYTRLIFIAYATLGVIFYGLGVFTTLGILVLFLNSGSIPLISVAAYFSYILLNIIIGYGFMYYRKWLTLAFLITFVLMGIFMTYFYTTGFMSRAGSMQVSIFGIIAILIWLFFTRRFLSGRYLAIRALTPFLGAFLLSFLLTNVSVLH